MDQCRVHDIANLRQTQISAGRKSAWDNATMTAKLETTYAALLGAVLAQLREAKKLNQADVAEHLGIHVSTWSRMEKGDGPITTEQLRKASEVLGISPAEILQLAEKAEENVRKTGIALTDLASIAAAARVGAVIGAVVPVFGSALGAIVGAAIAPQLSRFVKRKK